MDCSKPLIPRMIKAEWNITANWMSKQSKQKRKKDYEEKIMYMRNGLK